MLLTRNAQAADVPRLVEIERQTWCSEGTDVFGQEHFRSWLEIYPAGFWVVEDGGVIVGFTYIQAVDFGPADKSAFTTFNDMTDNGYTRRTHKPAGRYHFGVTMCSLVPGGGRKLLETALDVSQCSGRALMGSSRISGFQDYFKLARKSVFLPEDDVALSYVLACAKISGGRLWKSMAALAAPASVLPAVKAPDPVLKLYLRHPGLGLYALLPGFMKDPKSRNYSVLFGQAV